MTAHDPRTPRAAIRRDTQPRRGLSREEAALYVGVSPVKFDEGVESGELPKPKTGGFLGRRKVWDIRALDTAFDALPDEGGAGGGNSWD